MVVSVAAAGVAALVAAGALLAVALLAAAGVRRPLAFVRQRVYGVGLWLSFIAAAGATTGSLFFSEVAHFVPCELCWYQRLCMYPLAAATFIVAILDARRAAPWLLPVSILGVALSTYHVLLENGLAPQTIGCVQSLCALKWISEFGFATIPTLALGAFSLLTALLSVSAFDRPTESRTEIHA
jgi:disulfide bond formation protein DsbB